jgi:hypothetical protein
MSRVIYHSPIISHSHNLCQRRTHVRVIGAHLSSRGSDIKQVCVYHAKFPGKFAPSVKLVGFFSQSFLFWCRRVSMTTFL